MVVNFSDKRKVNTYIKLIAFTDKTVNTINKYKKW
jgi:hypothetical protein